MLPKLGKFLQAAVPFDRVKSDAFGMGVILLKFRVRGHFQFPFYQAWAARNSKLLFVRDMNSKVPEKTSQISPRSERGGLIKGDISQMHGHRSGPCVTLAIKSPYRSCGMS
jgi:hypothetical protein